MIASYFWLVKYIGPNTKVIPGLRMTIGVKALPFIPAVPIPIDHILLSQDFCATSVRIMPGIGSDHYPVLAEIKRGDVAIECMRNQ